ncbi:1-acyl-sn-glycerol-3-phosphate acyltransferase alpha-like [Hemicordylus capensis]|uniref:1-acyl-sn-glycerol-3-phosphate acyltransferase alpha-like n=1 Tax=Hemicordylus capensis TaxID=884348 RepID=UPI0023045F13|nr:1-acyl-sn-glycerol-3-phosphate acyltransferase alpha-like [Hemicordylus capensis]
MALSLGLANFILFFIGGFLLYHYSSTFRYYYKVCFLIGWMLGMSLLVLPLVAFRGRDVTNMRVLRLLMLPLKYILDVKINVQGATNLNLKGPYVMVANQQGNVDYLGMFQLLPERCTLIAEKEPFYMLPVGVVWWLSGFIFINYQKIADSISIMSAAADTMVQENLRIWMFLKQMTNNTVPIQHGAFHLAVQAQVPVIPVVMSSYQRFLNNKKKRFTPGEVTIKILPPMETQGLGPADVPELMERVQETMLSTFHEISGDAGKKA